MIVTNLQLRVDRFSDRKAGHLDLPATQILSRNTTRGISMKQIELTQGKVALVDDCDFKKLSNLTWCAKRTGNTFYVVRAHKIEGKKATLYMHRLIMDAQKGQQIDHRNNNGLDNRRTNLRFCTNSQNQQNRRKTQKTSKFKGVCWYSRDKKWQAGIKLNGKLYHLGTFNNEVEAAKVYDKKAKELFGEFVYTNF